MHNPEHCIFCQIIAGTLPAYIVDEDEHTMTFMDAFPVVPGHTLIVTKRHYDNVLEADPVAIAAVGAKSVAIGRAIKSALQPEGLGIFQLNGAAAGQTVFHYHMHLVPRNDGDSLQIHSRVPGDAEDLRTVAIRLRQALAPE